VPGPLLAVDAPSLLYRAFFALPKSITAPDGTPVNALLGVANLVLQVVESRRPRAVVLCFGAEAADYRVELYAAYHAERPPMPDELEVQWADAEAFFGAFGWQFAVHEELEADDLLGSLAQVERAAGGRTLLFTGDRDMFQCASESTTVLFPGGRGRDGPDEIGPDEVRRRYGVDPEQVPDFIALRGDPSDRLPGAPGIGAKTAAQLLRQYGSLEGALAAGRFGACRDELRLYRRLATLDASAPVPRVDDQTPDWTAASAFARELGLNRLAERLAAWGDGSA
jgi:5'-3' exonuclease